MSVAKVRIVGKAQKDQGKCEKCGVALSKGDPYKWFKVGFRSRFKHVRCMNPYCAPKPSELESTSKSNILAALEDAYANSIDVMSDDWAEDLKGVVENVQGAYDEYYSEKEDALAGWPNGNSQFEEMRDMAEQAKDAAENVEVDEEAEDRQAEVDRVLEELDGAMEAL